MRALEAALADSPPPPSSAPEADGDEPDHETSLLLQLHADVEAAERLVLERERAAAAADADHRRVQSKLERVQECVAQLRIAMAIQSAEHVREMECLGSRMLAPQALLDEFDGSAEGSQLKKQIEAEQALVWKPIVDAEHEYARTRAAVAVEHAEAKVRDDALRRSGELTEDVRNRLERANARRDVGERRALEAEARLAALRSEIDREEALVEQLRGNPTDDSMEQFQLLREQRETEKAVLALNDALGKSDKDVVDFLWSVEQDAPYSVVALHRYRRETSRLRSTIDRLDLGNSGSRAERAKTGADSPPRADRAASVDTVRDSVSDPEAFETRSELMPPPSFM